MTSKSASLDPSAPHAKFDYQEVAASRIYQKILSFPETSGSGDPEDEFAVNHVVALFGARGTGKTTVLLNVRKRLQSNSEDDGIIPTRLFVPDLLHDPDAIGPAMIQIARESLLKGMVDEDVIEAINDAFAEIMEDLSWFFNDKSIPRDVFIREAISSRHFATKTMDYYQATLTLPRRFGEAVKKCLKLRGAKRLVVLIDDADITLEMTEKVLDFVRYFLAMPQIVTVICADGDSIRRRLFNDRLERLGALDNLPGSEGASIFGMASEDFKKRELELEREYVDAFLVKLLPPSHRVILQLPDFRVMFRHKIATAGNRSIADILRSLEIHFKTNIPSISLERLTEKYPGVLDRNLRAFVNQFNSIAEIERDYETVYQDTVIVEDHAADFDVSNPLNIDTSQISPRDEAAIIAVLRVLFSNTAHDEWREVWSYHNVLDIMSETSLLKLLNVAITQINARGTSTNSLVFRISGTSSGQGTLLSKKEQSHVFHLILDLALQLGADFPTIAMSISLVPSEAYSHLPIDHYLEDLIKSDYASDLLRNTRLVSSNRSAKITATLSTEGYLERVLPVHVTDSAELALHYHYTLTQSKQTSIRDSSDTYTSSLDDKEMNQAGHLSLNKGRIYEILYRLMVSISDQVRSAIAVVDGGKDFSGSNTMQLGHAANLSLSWRTHTPLQGWSVLAKVMSNKDDIANNFERKFSILIHLAQHAYPVLFGVFSSEGRERDAKDATISGCEAFRDELVVRGFVGVDGQFVNHAQFLKIIDDKPDDYARLATSARLWPNVDTKPKGDKLIGLLNYIESDPETLGDTDLRSNPPPSWAKLVDELDHDTEEVAKAEPSGTDT